jgi:hypothetical protein
MKRLKGYLFFILALCLPPAAARADSPITSTDFYTVYMDQEIVERAASRNVLDGEIAAYLIDPANPIDVKAAAINALGWKFEGRNNSELFTWYLAAQRGTPLAEFSYDTLDPGELFSLAYLTVLDDYFNPAPAVPMILAANRGHAEQSGQRKPNKKETGGSLTIALVQSLIQGQAAMDGDWCEIWRATERVLDNDSLQQDMRPAAVDIIVEYMSLYRDDCL